MTDFSARSRTIEIVESSITADRIGRESIRGGALALGGAAVELTIRLGTLIVLARLLKPGDFGLFAMAMVPVGILFPLSRFGFPTAVVQRSTLRHEHVSRLFWFNLKLNGLLACVAVLLAFPLAIYFGERKLVWLTLVGAFGNFFSGTTGIHLGILRRKMRFGVITLERCLAAVCGAATAVGLALAGAGVWALMIQQTVTFLVTSVVRWIGAQWRPASPRRSAKLTDPAVRELLRFGRHVLFVNLLEHLVKESHPLIVGGIANIRVVGLYQNARRWASMPVTDLLTPVHMVAVSGMSRLRDTSEGYRRYARAVMVGVYSTVIPFLVLVIIDARSIIHIVLGSQWLDATLFLRLLAIATSAECLLRVATWCIYAEGRTERIVRWALGHAIACTGAMCLGAIWGAVGVAAGFAIATWMYVLPTFQMTVLSTPLRWTDLGRAVMRPLFASSVACAAATLSTQDSPAALHFLMRTLIFVAVYALAWLAVPGALRELRSVHQIAHDRHPSAGRSQPTLPTDTPIHEQVQGVDSF